MVLSIPTADELAAEVAVAVDKPMKVQAEFAWHFIHTGSSDVDPEDVYGA